MDGGNKTCRKSGKPFYRTKRKNKLHDMVRCLYLSSLRTRNYSWKVTLNKRSDNKPEHCYCCGAELSGRIEKAMTTYFDEYLNEPCVIAKEVPVRINYTYGKKKYEKDLDDNDLKVIQKIKLT